MAQTAVDVVVRVKDLASLSRLEKSLQSVDGAVVKSAQSVKKFESSMAGLKGAIAGVAGIAGVSLGLGKLFTDLEKADKANAALRTLGIETKSFNQDLENLRKSLDNNVSQLELQQGAFAVAQAGFKDTADQVKILEAAVKSSQAKLVGTDVSITAITSVLKSYGLEASSAATLSEKFFKTIADGNLTLPEYAQVIGGIAPLASQAGVSLNELNAGIAALTQRGLTAGEATTGLERIIAALIDPSAQAAKLANELGLAFNEQALKAKGLDGVLREIIEKTGGSTQKLSELFGSLEAVNAAVAISANGFADFDKALENQGKAAGKVDNAYNEMSNTIIGATKRLQNTVTATGQSFVKDFEQPIIRALDGLGLLFKSLDTPIGKLFTNIGLVTGAVIALNKAIVALKATALAAWLTQQAALMSAFGAKIYLAAAAATALEKALLLAKAAFLGLPLALVALLVGEVTGSILDAEAAQREWTQQMSTTETAVEALRAKAAELQAKLDGVETSSYAAATATGYTGGAFATASINAANYASQLANVRAQLLALTDPFAGANVIKGFDELDPSGIQEALRLAGVTKPTGFTPTGGGSSRSGGGSAAPTDDIAGLQARKQLLEQIAPIQEKINKAILAGDEQLVIRLEGEKQMAELKSQGEEAVRRLNTEEGKNLQLKINQLEQSQLLVETQQQLDELAKSQQDAINDVVQSLQDEANYLNDIIQYGEKEAGIRQRINSLMQDLPETERARIEEMVRGNAALQERADQIQNLEAQYESLASSIAGEMTGAFRSVIDGTKTVEEAFSDMLKGIADAFLDMAMKILQDAITKQLLQLFTSLFSAGTGAPSIGGGGGFGGGIGLAEGGYITKPTQAMIGEAGEPEYAIPASKMASAMARYNAGMRGDAVIAGASEHGDAEQGAYGSGSGNAPINVNYSGPIMRMDNTDYVKTSEIPGIVNQSAKAGEARALGRLRTSVGVRRKVGMA